MVKSIVGYCLVCAVVFIASCATSFRLPNKDITIKFSTLEYLAANEQELLFYGHGSLLNPNELNIRPVSFTYQMSIDGKFYSKGKITPQRLRDGKLYFKSNSPYRIPIEVTFAALGGIGKAMKRTTFNYGLNFQFHDERGKRSSLSHDGTVNLTPLLKPVYFREVRVHASDEGSADISFSIINDNDFELALDSCSFTLQTRTNTLEQQLQLPWTIIEEHSDERIRMTVASTFQLSEPFRFTGTCIVDGESFGNRVSGVVR